MTIIQTSNHGLLLSGFPDGVELVGIEVDLSLNGDTLKHWSISDVEVDGANIICPLSQNDTANFPKGIARLEFKGIDADGVTLDCEPQSVKIAYRADKTIQGDGDYASSEYAEVPITLQSDTAIIRKGYSPYIDDDGIWWEYSTSDKEFVNTGVSAKGIKGDKGDRGNDGVGKDGKDGTSVTHSWRGTTLVVTSASGTSSADLRGAKGDKGDRGADGLSIKGDKGDKGDSYTITEADYDVIADVVREKSRVTPMHSNIDIAQTYEAVGCPDYINEANLSKYSAYGIIESGWYLFPRIRARQGEKVSAGFSVAGGAGYIEPHIGDEYIDIAIKFGVAAESQKVIINWGETTESFVFKATDLAVRNLDYRVTFYLYDIDEYCSWEYELTSDTTFAEKKGYYKLVDGQYVKEVVTVGDEVPAGTYYTHKSLSIRDFTRNMSYTLDTIVDCPIVINLPEVGADNYGAWFEVQMNFLKTYSVTIIPSEGQLVSANGVHNPTAGINIINLLYHKPTNTWLPTVTHWNNPAN